MKRCLARAMAAFAFVLGVLSPGGPIWAQVGVPGRAFRFEYAPRVFGGPAIEGYVHNDGPSRLTNVRLRVEALAADGTTTAEAFGWVLGDVGPGGRGYFVVHIPATAPGYRISVLSFDLVS